jgi:hypothetical protein
MYLTMYSSQVGQELSERTQGEAQALLETALAAPATLSVDSHRVDRLCSLVAQLLSHGLTGKPAAPAGWLSQWLDSSKPSALAVLQVGYIWVWGFEQGEIGVELSNCP